MSSAVESPDHVKGFLKLVYLTACVYPFNNISHMYRATAISSEWQISWQASRSPCTKQKPITQTPPRLPLPITQELYLSLSLLYVEVARIVLINSYSFFLSRSALFCRCEPCQSVHTHASTNEDHLLICHETKLCYVAILVFILLHRSYFSYFYRRSVFVGFFFIHNPSYLFLTRCILTRDSSEHFQLLSNMSISS